MVDGVSITMQMHADSLLAARIDQHAVLIAAMQEHTRQLAWYFDTRDWLFGCVAITLCILHIIRDWRQRA